MCRREFSNYFFYFFAVTTKLKPQSGDESEIENEIANDAQVQVAKMKLVIVVFVSFASDANLRCRMMPINQMVSVTLRTLIAVVRLVWRNLEKFLNSVRCAMPF